MLYAYIVERFFGRSRQWLNNKLKENQSFGRTAAFTPEEVKKLSAALVVISEEIKTAALPVCISGTGIVPSGKQHLGVQKRHRQLIIPGGRRWERRAEECKLRENKRVHLQKRCCHEVNCE